MKPFPLLYLLVFALVGCTGPRLPSTTGGGKTLKVVCTTGMLADVTQKLLGSNGTVTALMGPGVDPHLYKATASDVTALQSADVVFYNGLHLEGKMVEIFHALQGSGRKVVGAAEGIDRSRLRFIKAGDTYPDPHIWFDVALWSEVVDPIARTLSEVDSAHAAEYGQRAAALKREMQELHGWCKSELARIPPERRILVTSHDAFGYFGRAYDVEVVALQGISTVSEASTSDVTALVDYLKKRKIPAIFVESSVPKATMERVSTDAGVQIGGELFSDAMGPAGTEEGTYPGMIRYNVGLIVRGLK
jgi:manganese/zinc/iron transport system substrate-binding protein